MTGDPTGRTTADHKGSNPIAEQHMIGQTELAEFVSEALAGRVACELTCEINTLLAGVVSVATNAMGYGSLLERRRALETIARYGRETSKLVRSFQLSFQSSASSQAAPSVDVAEALDRSLLLCWNRARAQRVEVRRKCRGVPRARADVGKCEQAFIGLFHRALDAMPGGGVLEVTAARTGDSVAVTMSDNGTGSVDVRGALAAPESVEPTGTPPRAIGQRGACADRRALELSFMRSMIGRHGGSLMIESAANGGFRFTVLLPCGAEAPPGVESGSSKGSR